MFKISFTPSPMLPLTASDAGTHILLRHISQTKINANITALPDGMQPFRGWTIRAGTV
jgi:hypothetical protein